MFDALVKEFLGPALTATGGDGGCSSDATPRVILPEAHAADRTALTELGFSPVRTSRYLIRRQAPAQQRDQLNGIAAYSLG